MELGRSFIVLAATILSYQHNGTTSQLLTGFRGSCLS
jgi:hypothetical protein